jgi:hypothetical protein
MYRELRLLRIRWLKRWGVFRTPLSTWGEEEEVGWVVALGREEVEMGGGQAY